MSLTREFRNTDEIRKTFERYKNLKKSVLCKNLLRNRNNNHHQRVSYKNTLLNEFSNEHSLSKPKTTKHNYEIRLTNKNIEVDLIPKTDQLTSKALDDHCGFKNLTKENKVSIEAKKLLHT